MSYSGTGPDLDCVQISSDLVDVTTNWVMMLTFRDVFEFLILRIYLFVQILVASRTFITCLVTLVNLKLLSRLGTSLGHYNHTLTYIGISKVTGLYESLM